MKKSMTLLFAAGTAVILAFSGCGKAKEEPAPVAPTAAPTAMPTAVPVTAKPLPTATPTPRSVGEKTPKSKFVYITNNLGTRIREIYLMESGNEDWGENLLPSESSIKKSEQIQLFYTPDSDGETEEFFYDIKLVTAEGDSYEIYSAELSDMQKAVLTIDQETSAAYLRYMSLSDKKEKDTKENSQKTADESAYSSESDTESYDNGSSNDGSYNSGSSNGGSYDSESTDDESGEDGSVEDGSAEDGSGEDGNAEDGSGEDGNAEDGSTEDGSGEDGSYEDGSTDDGFVDAGDGGDDGYYDTSTY